MKTYNIAAMGGDGIGPEVVDAAVKTLKVCAERDGGFKLNFQDFDWGSDYYKKHGVMMPADGADQLRKFDAILFGAVGAPDIPDHITRYGVSGWRFVNLSISMRTCARPVFCPALPAHCDTFRVQNLIGLSCARILKANIPASVVARTKDCRLKLPRMSQ